MELLLLFQRRFIGINPERGTKAIPGKVVSKKTAVIVQKKSTTVNTHVSTPLKNLLDFEWDFIYWSGNTGKERNKDQQGNMTKDPVLQQRDGPEWKCDCEHQIGAGKVQDE
ncbi:hypothetical protein KUCAC02_019206 [Chaenocephalus aceratus]|uniref:Uncharacterized protein n=1 Tax=Chaenocephalus aceratus TaxID=36190 RepID=A0ACB9WCJ8_CHAAC|nr:hypothetical protein KUCAC02_019206 [Chaenocephalus aceratus]